MTANPLPALLSWRPAAWLVPVALLAACASPGAPSGDVAPRTAATPSGVSPGVSASAATGGGTASAAGPGASIAAPVSQEGLAPVPVADLSVLRPETRHRYRELQSASGRVYLLDPARSDIRIYVFRAGLAARLGHNHVLSVPRFSGLAWAPAKGLPGTRADFGFRLSDLQVDPPALRAETGGGFATALDAEDIRGTYEHLLSERGFDAASHPWVEVSASLETGEVPVAIADLALTLHGETHHQRVVIKLQLDEHRLDASGTLAFRQGDYGIKPYSVAGGLLAVEDVVAVEFHLRGAPLVSAIP